MAAAPMKGKNRDLSGSVSEIGNGITLNHTSKLGNILL